MTVLVPSAFSPARDASAADWIVRTVKPWGRDRVRLWSFLPDTFERYARVLHPARRTEGTRGTVRWRDLAARRGVTIGPATGFREVSGLDPADQTAWYNAAPNEGTLEPEQVAALAEILEPFTETPGRCWAAIWEGWGSWRPGSSATLVSVTSDAQPAPAPPRPAGVEIDIDSVARFEIPHRAYLLFSARVAEVPTFAIGGWHQAPSIWWPDDRAWCVATEVDGCSTYVGGSAPCVAALIGSDEVEAIEVAADFAFDPGAS
ncbi:MAG: hypothetical protein ACRDKS_15110 [Actinomycetota bacterium]